MMVTLFQHFRWLAVVLFLTGFVIIVAFAADPAFIRNVENGERYLLASVASGVLALAFRKQETRS